MKQFYILLMLVLLTFAGYGQARTLITFAKASGNWSAASSWSPVRVPQNSDSVVIPQNRTVIFDQAASYTNMYITIAGTVSLKNKLTLDASSIIEIKPTGNVTLFSGGNSSIEMIIPDGKIKFDQSSNNPTTGPAAANRYSIGFGPVSILPVIFTSFSAIKDYDNRVSLKWAPHWK